MAQERLSSLEKFFVLYAVLVVAALSFGGYLFLTDRLNWPGIGLLIFILATLALAGYYIGNLAYNMYLASLQAEVSVVLAQINPEKEPNKIGFAVEDPAVSGTRLDEGNDQEDYDDEMEKQRLFKRHRKLFRFKKN